MPAIGFCRWRSARTGRRWRRALTAADCSLRPRASPRRPHAVRRRSTHFGSGIQPRRPARGWRNAGRSNPDLGHFGQTRQPIRTAASHTASVTGLRFGRTLLASSSLDGTVKLWRAQPSLNLDHPIVIADRAESIWAVTLSPDDDRSSPRRRSPSAIADDEDHLACRRICSHVSGNLTREEWNEYVSAALEYQPTCPGRSAGHPPDDDSCCRSRWSSRSRTRRSHSRRASSTKPPACTPRGASSRRSN